MEIRPRFLLSVNPADIDQKYAAGYFNRGPVAKSKIVINRSVPTMAPVYNPDKSQGVYSIQERNNTFLYATTGHTDLKVLHETGHLPMGGICDKCKRTFTNEIVGYPIRYEGRRVLIIDNGGPTYHTIHTFQTKGRFCQPGCALAHLQETKITALTVDSERLLRLWYKLKYKDGLPLIASKCHHLAIEEGGSLTADMMADPKFEFNPLHRVCEIPIKEEYLQRAIQKTTTPGELARELAQKF